MFTASVMPSSYLILLRPLLLLFLIFPSIRDFFNESSVHNRWPKYCSFSISPSSEYLGLISLKIIGLILLSRWLLGFFSSTTVQRPQFFGVLPFLMVQFSQPCVTTGEIIALTTWTFVNKVLALLFNILYRFVITFLPRNNCFLILEPKKRKSVFSVFTIL